MSNKEQKQFLTLACIPKKHYPNGLSDVPSAVTVRCEYCDNDMWVGPKKFEALILAKQNKLNHYFGCYECFPKKVNINEFGEVNILHYPGS